MTQEEIIDKIYSETFGIIDKVPRIEQIKTYIELYDKFKTSDKQED